MLVDSTLTFASRRHIPVRYDRELAATTLSTMQRVSEIKTKRERAFYKNRMAGNKAKQRFEDARLVSENQHLLKQNEAIASKTEKMEQSMRTAEPIAVPVVLPNKLRRRLKTTATSSQPMALD